MTSESGGSHPAADAISMPTARRPNSTDGTATVVSRGRDLAGRRDPVEARRRPCRPVRRRSVKRRASIKASASLSS